MSDDKIPSCGNCRFFRRHSHESMAFGFCHRHPPTTLSVTRGDRLEARTMFPSVDQDNWCGEHEVGTSPVHHDDDCARIPAGNMTEIGANAK